MNADQTHNSIAFSKLFDNEDGSRRQSNARGVTTPDVLNIKHMDTVDGATKVASRRHTVRLDKYYVDVGGLPFKDTIYVVQDISAKSDSAKAAALIADMRAIVANTTAGTNVLAAVQNNES